MYDNQSGSKKTVRDSFERAAPWVAPYNASYDPLVDPEAGQAVPVGRRWPNLGLGRERSTKALGLQIEVTR
jgi:hypothetical protein